MPLDKAVKLAAFLENMLSHKTVFLSPCRSLWEHKLLHTLVPAARLFSCAACLAISHGTGVSKSCSRRVSFWDWGEYDDLSKVVGLVAKFGARVEIIFAHILVFPACAIEVQHIDENSPTMGLHPRVHLARAWSSALHVFCTSFVGVFSTCQIFNQLDHIFEAVCRTAVQKNRPSGKLYVGTFINLRKKTTAFSKYKLMKGGGGGGGKGETLM